MNAPMRCRHCGGGEFVPFLDLGRAPPSNSYLADKAAIATEKTYPLVIRTCTQCWLTQTEDFADREEFFSADYAYFSSFSASWLEHARIYVETMRERFGLGPENLVCEVAANDGYLLRHVKAAGIPCYGIEPTASTAKAARALGIDIVEEFFGAELAGALSGNGRQADLIAANNVLAHVPDINDFVSGFAAILADDGVSTFEFPHLLNLLEKTQFDTIYHEHFSYLSLYAVEKCFESNGLKVFDVEELPTHGGSLRVWAQKTIGTRPETDRLAALRAKEAEAGIATLACYQGFDAKCRKIRDDLLAFLKSAKTEGKTVAGYGAAAKGNTLLNYCDIGTDLIDFVVDANPHKQNTLLPGSHIPVHAPDHLKVAKPDYVLILPWNLSTEIMKSMSHVSDWGGKFMVAIPRVEVIG